MSVDKDAAQAFDAEPFNKSHTTHVRSEIINLRGALTNAIAIFLQTAVKANILGLWHAQVPLANWLLIYRPDSCKTFVGKVFRQISTNEATRTGNDD
jgi:hypothetical protein